MNPTIEPERRARVGPPAERKRVEGGGEREETDADSPPEITREEKFAADRLFTVPVCVNDLGH